MVQYTGTVQFLCMQQHGVVLVTAVFFIIALLLQVGESYQNQAQALTAGSLLEIYITPRDDKGGLIFWPLRTDFNVSVLRTDKPNQELFSTFPEHTYNGYHTSASPPRIMVARRVYTVRP